MIVCPKCKNKVDDSRKVCLYCGADLRESSSDTPTSDYIKEDAFSGRYRSEEVPPGQAQSGSKRDRAEGDRKNDHRAAGPEADFVPGPNPSADFPPSDAFAGDAEPGRSDAPFGSPYGREFVSAPESPFSGPMPDSRGAGKSRSKRPWVIWLPERDVREALANLRGNGGSVDYGDNNVWFWVMLGANLLNVGAACARLDGVLRGNPYQIVVSAVLCAVLLLLSFWGLVKTLQKKEDFLLAYQTASLAFAAESILRFLLIYRRFVPNGFVGRLTVCLAVTFYISFSVRPRKDFGSDRFLNRALVIFRLK